jgi:acyl-CoA synthetase (AMP-forming)/AMP-acid ligase II
MSTRGDGPSLTIPALLSAAAGRLGRRPAVEDGQTRLTYGELSEEARSFGAALVASGIEPGDRVAIWAFNCAEWIVALLGLLQAGAVLVPINTRFKGREAADILSRSAARALVTVTDFLGTDYVEMLRANGTELPQLRTIVIARGRAPDGVVPWAAFLDRASAQARTVVDRRQAELGPDDPSDILFTSGTTGLPKGVVMSHRRTLRVATDWVEMTGLGADDRYLMVNPYFHMFGLKAGILACVASGALMLPEAVFDVDRVLGRVQAERVTVLPGSPTVYQAILDCPDRARRDLSTLRVAVTGAADIPVELIRRIDEELPFSTIITGYGLTEAGTAAATSPGDDVETIATTVGRPRPGFEVRVVGAGDAEAPAGEPGEILLRGPSVMVGYLDDPEATAQGLSPDGWLRTGDIGVLDAAGCLRIVGRSKDMFIVGGFNAYPAEIENVLLRHPDIAQAAVIGIPDDRLGQVGMAFVVPRSRQASAAAIIEWSRDQMANYKVPRVVELVDELPINATGKVVKDELRQRAGVGGASGAHA